MQIQGPVPPLFHGSFAPGARAAAAPAERTAASAPKAPPSPAAASAPALQATLARSAPATAESGPAAAESSLWDLLTPEEREFFTRAAELGPLTYRPGGASPIGVPLPTGQRIDVRG